MFNEIKYFFFFDICSLLYIYFSMLFSKTYVANAAFFRQVHVNYTGGLGRT